MDNAFHEARKVLDYNKFKKRFWDNVALRYISEKKAAAILEPFGLTPAEFLAARAKYIRAICREIDKRLAAMPYSLTP